MMSVGTSGAIQAPPASAGVLGQGIKYPPEVDPTTGRLKLAWGGDLVDQSIQSIAMTQPYERPMLPGYGAASMTFEPVDEHRFRLLLEANIAEYEPRASDVQVKVVPLRTAETEARITYSVIGEANTRTLTAPLFSGPASTGADK